MWRLYGLVDLDYHKIGYVGTTQRELAPRLSEHLSRAKKDGGKKNEWIVDAMENGRGITIVELPWPEGVDPDDWETAEQKTIAQFKAGGFAKFNESIGGAAGTGRTLSEEHRQAISEGVKRHLESKVEII